MAKANEGDLIIVTNTIASFGKYAAGDIIEVLATTEDGVRTAKGELFNDEFEVIETHKFIDIIATLARRTSALENQLRMTQGNIETLAQEMASLESRQKEQREIIESNISDIVLLDERTAAHNISVNLRIDREADVSKIAEEIAKLIANGDGSHGY